MRSVVEVITNYLPRYIGEIRLYNYPTSPHIYINDLDFKTFEIYKVTLLKFCYKSEIFPDSTCLHNSHQNICAIRHKTISERQNLRSY